jgi:hypothetical protein
VQVVVDQAGTCEAALQIDHFRLGPFQGQDVGIGTRGEHLALPDSQRLTLAVIAAAPDVGRCEGSDQQGYGWTREPPELDAYNVGPQSGIAATGSRCVKDRRAKPRVQTAGRAAPWSMAPRHGIARYRLDLPAPRAIRPMHSPFHFVAGRLLAPLSLRQQWNPGLALGKFAFGK